MALTPTEIARHGGTDPWETTRPMRGGRFSFGLETPSLRNVSINGVEIAQTITFSVRDKRWGTVDSTNWATSDETSGGQVDITMGGRFTAEDIDLDATIRVSTDRDGSLRYSVTAVALRDFERARIGICVMHAGTLTGQTLRVTTPDETYSTTFPDEISASRDISNIVSLSHRMCTDRDVVFEFEGELFEFEDQRNWTDNSYKTFCTPLSMPWPVGVTAGDVVEQTMRISTVERHSTVGVPDSPLRIAEVDDPIDPDQPGDSMSSDLAPSIGVLCDMDPSALSVAVELGVPHVRITLDGRSAVAPADLARVAKALSGSRTQIELEIVADEPTDIARFHDVLAELGDRVRSVFVFDRTTQITPMSYGSAIDALRSHTGLNIGGGSGSNFGAINFHVDNVALDSIQTLTFPMSPQVHYTDDFTIMTNLDAQSTVASNAVRIADGKPLAIGPITFLPRRAGEPLARDPRSDSLLGAAWTVASMESLISSGAASLTYHQIGGAGGLVIENGSLTPIYHLLADLSEFRGVTRSPVKVESDGSRVGVIALARGPESLLIVANVGPDPIDVAVDLPSEGVKIRVLDESTYDVAMKSRTAFTSLSTAWSGGSLHLLPFAIATLHVSKPRLAPPAHTGGEHERTI